jgi:hypothetical protein
MKCGTGGVPSKRAPRGLYELHGRDYSAMLALLIVRTYGGVRVPANIPIVLASEMESRLTRCYWR